MKKIKIVTDSASSIPEHFLEKLGVATLQIPIVQDGKPITLSSTDEFYRLLEEGNVPKTSAPAPGSYLSLYKELLKEYDVIISIHISSKVSATYQSACVARDMVPDSEIHVVDSENISMATGFIVLAAARAATKGTQTEEILHLIESLKQRVGGLVALPTLSFLSKSGRISQAKALMGNLLSLKPILMLKQGSIDVVRKSRSFNNALQVMMEMVEDILGDVRVHVAVIHSNAQDKAKDYMKQVAQRLNCEEIFPAEMGPGLAVHGGPNMLGLVWMIAE